MTWKGSVSNFATFLWYPNYTLVKKESSPVR